MRKKHVNNQLACEYPERIFVWNRDPSEFVSWLNEQRTEQALSVEIGMGTGDFLISQAKLFPNRFFLGLEIKKDRIYKAFKKAQAEGINNIAFLQTDARNLIQYNFPLLESLYLLFSDPWPKKRHARRRLTSERFLTLYHPLLGESGQLVLKTDNSDLFGFSLESLRSKDWRILEENKNFRTPEDEQSAYERNFVLQGIPINYAVAKPS
ncbi:MAG: tRNA (guanosine(46)-N7)-methyltransferase TrmB [bacterium]|nr:tRNA (guanosine(46)-N7)-methyltransferase TrmB [bacterium]